MTELARDTAIQSAIALLTCYNFDLGGNTAEQMVSRWLNDYQPIWIFWAVIEALYQGRYKGVSVEQILVCWKRRNQPLYHFNTEFERIVCRNFPCNLNAAETVTNSSADTVLSPNSLPWETEQQHISSPLQEQEKSPSSGSDSININIESTPRQTAEDLLSPVLEQVDIDIESTPISQNIQAILQLVDEASASFPEPPSNSLSSSINKKLSPYNYKLNWSRCDVIKQPINSFIPPLQNSDFYDKLRLVAQAPREGISEQPSVEDDELKKDIWADD